MGHKPRVEPVVMARQRLPKRTGAFKGNVLEAEGLLHGTMGGRRFEKPWFRERRLRILIAVFGIHTFHQVPVPEGIHFFFFGHVEGRAFKHVMEG